MAADRVSYELTSYQNVVAALGMVPQLSDDTVITAEKQQLVDPLGRLLQYGTGQPAGHNRKQPV